MKKNTYRLVFNKSRGCMMAVLETASNCTKSPSGTSKTRRRSSKCGKTTKAGQFSLSKVALAQWILGQAAPDLILFVNPANNQFNPPAANNESSKGSIPITGSGSPGGSVSASKSNVDSSFQSVGQQSGLKAGDGGFQVSVNKNTALTGGVIASTQGAVDNKKNTFTTGGALSITDVQNTASFKGTAVGFSVGVGTQPAGGTGLSGVGVGIGSTSGNASSTSSGGISGIAGNTAVRTGDAETGLKPVFDADKVQKEINAQVAITQAFTREAPKAVATFSDKQREELKKDLTKETDPDKQKAISSEIDKWGEGGRYRILLHTLAGALGGGASGAAGATASASAAPLMNQLQDGITVALKDVGLGTNVAKGIASGITGLTAAGVGAIVGGTQGAAIGFTVDVNNRQLHPTEAKLIKDNATAFAKQKFGTNSPTASQVVQAETDLAQQAVRQFDGTWAILIGNETNKDAQSFLKQIAGAQTFTNDQGTQQGIFTAVTGDFNNAMRGAATAATSSDVMDLYKRDLQPYAQATSALAGTLNAFSVTGGGIKNAATGLVDAAVALVTKPIDTLKVLHGAVVESVDAAGQGLATTAAVATDPASKALLDNLYGRSDASIIAGVVATIPAATLVAPIPVAGKVAVEVAALKTAAKAGRLEYNVALAGLDDIKTAMLKDGKSFEETFNNISALRSELKIDVRNSTGPALGALTTTYDTVRGAIPGLGSKFDLDVVMAKAVDRLKNESGVVNPSREQIFEKILESSRKPNALANKLTGIGSEK